MELVPASETSRRARAAIAYSGREQDDVQEATTISAATFRRIVARKNPRAAGVEELWQIADACGVPRRFMEEGFASVEDAGRPEWARRLEVRLEQLEGRLPTTPLGEEDADPEADLGRELEGGSPSEEDDDQSGEQTGQQS